MLVFPGVPSCWNRIHLKKQIEYLAVVLIKTVPGKVDRIGHWFTLTVRKGNKKFLGSAVTIFRAVMYICIFRIHNMSHHRRQHIESGVSPRHLLPITTKRTDQSLQLFLHFTKNDCYSILCQPLKTVPWIRKYLVCI